MPIDEFEHSMTIDELRALGISSDAAIQVELVARLDRIAVALEALVDASMRIAGSVATRDAK